MKLVSTRILPVAIYIDPLIPLSPRPLPRRRCISSLLATLVSLWPGMDLITPAATSVTGVAAAPGVVMDVDEMM